MTEEIPIVKTCQGCINLILYAGSSTGECDIHQKGGWISSLTEACSKYWPNTQICLTCAHWDAVKYKGISQHWGSCCYHDEGKTVHKCHCYCTHWEERENLREYLNNIIEGKE